MIRRSTVVLSFVAVAMTASALPAQASAPAVAADTMMLSLDRFLTRIRLTHPLARQADLTERQVRADAQAARGAFDPYVAATWDAKRFKGIGYYDELDAKVVVPTPWGVDLKVGWERAAGQIINPERTTPNNGLLSAGISLPLGPRLLADERRTALRQAELAESAAEAERDGAIVRLLQGAARDWGAWYEAEARAEIARDGVALARFRFEATRRRVDAGDAAPIDSVEALAELERRLVAESEARASAASARLTVVGYLWTREGAPETPTSALRPVDPFVAGTMMMPVVGDAAIARAVATHPSVQTARARFLQADAQRRLVATQVLPSASVDASALASGRSLGELPGLDAIEDDYKVGASLKLPLLMRRELGRWRAATQRAQVLGWERDRVQRDVRLAVERALVDLRAVDEQAARQARVVAASETLLAAEVRRFEAGESSLLIVNLRERALLDERQRRATIAARRASAMGALAAAMGSAQILMGETADPSAR
ncbi:MAG: TolC family protein [Gemmatimonadaceae bacterium]|nr:TolC family protein [Gemmatimonadaceae bacterium]